MKILFAQAAAEAFAELPQSTKRKAASSIELLVQHPRMYPLRRRGLMRGYRYFAAGRHLIYYSVNSQEVRIAAIIPGAMRRA
ncbi:MAG TPA: type II toxin-antitoxin system RelE/ParE family toxin [Bryobacteraceae bacterium]|nr:type II toxin-antitoxin system RelE/ParE family toxin [Bryobacteraceae bacterium]